MRLAQSEKWSWDNDERVAERGQCGYASFDATYSLMLLVNALGLLRDVKTHAEDTGSNTKTSLAAQGGSGSYRLVDVKKGGVDLGVAGQGVGLEVAAADGRASLGDLLQVSTVVSDAVLPGNSVGGLLGASLLSLALALDAFVGDLNSGLGGNKRVGQ
jgi:hypothetical protein